MIVLSDSDAWRGSLFSAMVLEQDSLKFIQGVSNVYSYIDNMGIRLYYQQIGPMKKMLRSNKKVLRL